MADELLKCPFCGSKPLGVENNWESGGQVFTFLEIECQNGHCYLNKASKNKDESINLWNTRASQSRIEELERENAELKEEITVAEKAIIERNRVLEQQLSDEHTRHLATYHEAEKEVARLTQQLSEANARIARLRELLKMHDFLPEGRCIHCGHDEYADGGYHANDCEYKKAMEE